MPTNFSTHTSGGKGNLGYFIERDSKICAAGKPTSQPDQSVKDLLTHYCLQDEVKALIGDAKIPVPKVTQLPPRGHDMRNAGIFNEGRNLLNPPVKTKFQTLVADFKSTTYKSYWAGVGKVPDQIPFLPEGFKIYHTVLGKKNKHENLYDIVMPVDPIPDNTPNSNKIGYQVNRSYCLFNPHATYGRKAKTDPSGSLVKACLVDNGVLDGTASKTLLNETQANYRNASAAKLGVALTPNNNIECVPEGFTFGKLYPPSDNLPDCLRTCEINLYKMEIKKCLGHLNTLRQCLAKRFDRNFYRKFYLSLKFVDESKSGWLQKQFVYNQCNANFIRFNPSFIEPLLSLWHAFDGSQIEYKTFIHVINHNEPSPEIPKIQDLKCVDFRTTYGDSYSYILGFDKSEPMAGKPSGSYFDKAYPATPDGCCKAETVYLPEESDAKTCLCPSIFTLLGVSHRDMYAKRDPELVKKVFKNAGETFTDNEFEAIWEIAKKSHSQGWVCFETFRRSIDDYKNTCENGI